MFLKRSRVCLTVSFAASLVRSLLVNVTVDSLVIHCVPTIAVF